MGRDSTGQKQEQEKEQEQAQAHKDGQEPGFLTLRSRVGLTICFFFCRVPGPEASPAIEFQYGNKSFMARQTAGKGRGQK